MDKPIQTILCDLDGVITQTAAIHAKAWKLLFDDFLTRYAYENSQVSTRFDITKDYPEYIDGKPRLEGIKSYLNKLHIELEEGVPEDPSGKHTIHGLAKRKNEIFNALLAEEGVEIYPKSIQQLRSWKKEGIKTAVVSSSKNCRNILRSAQLESLFDVIVDGVTAGENNLKGKPDPDTFLYAAKLLNADPADAMVVEDSLAGIVAGKRGKFGLVVGIVHDHNEGALYRSGANHVVNNLEELAEKISLSRYLVKDGFDPYRERIVESLLSFANGYMGTRNSLEEGYSFSEQSTYISGIYREIPGTSSNKLARIPDWTRMQVFLDDHKIDLLGSKILAHKRYLDLRRGLVVRKWRSQDKAGRIIYIEILKFISLSSKHEAFKCLSVTSENFSGKIRVVSGIDGKDINSDIFIPPGHGKIGMIAQVKGSTRSVRLLQQSRVVGSDHFSYKKRTGTKSVCEEWEWMAEPGKTYTVESVVTISSGLANTDQKVVYRTEERFFQDCLDAHIQCWEKRWKKSGIKISGDLMETQTGINFALYHLISAGEFNGHHTSIGARGLTGINYQGHVFWDTEIYLLPFYLFTAPEIAKALLMYRYQTLNGARENARLEGQKGACYAWESTDSGLEMTPTEIISPYGRVIPIYSSLYEIHISPDIAYATWQYWQVTHDKDFLLHYGAEIIVETARFCDFFLQKETDGLYHIRDVVGPDEYHERIDDNAYTNFMAGYNLEIALKVVEILNREYGEEYRRLRNKINLQEEEVDSWQEKRDKIYTGYHPETKIYEQFKGYFDLAYIELESYEPRKVPMDMLLGEKIKQTQVTKQADVLMFLFLLAGKFPKEAIEANYNYYEPRASHGSSLSPGIHSIVAARLGKADEAYKYFKKNAEIDLNDKFGNAAGGVHMASIGGTWMSVVMGFAGMYIHDNGLSFDPHLPDQWEKVEIPIHWRNQEIKIQLGKGEIKLEVTGKKAVNVSIGEVWRELVPGNTYSACKDEMWKWEC